MLSIRLRRAGAKGRAFFRVVVTESKSARDGRFVEMLGQYDPRAQPATVNIKRDRLAYWIEKGAKPSDTVRTLVARMPPPEAATEPAAAGQPAAEA